MFKVEGLRFKDLVLKVYGLRFYGYRVSGLALGLRLA